jgi:hypothetical protein
MAEADPTWIARLTPTEGRQRRGPARPAARPRRVGAPRRLPRRGRTREPPRRPRAAPARLRGALGHAGAVRGADAGATVSGGVGQVARPGPDGTRTSQVRRPPAVRPPRPASPRGAGARATQSARGTTGSARTRCCTGRRTTGEWVAIVDVGGSAVRMRRPTSPATPSAAGPPLPAPAPGRRGPGRRRRRPARRREPPVPGARGDEDGIRFLADLVIRSRPGATPRTPLSAATGPRRCRGPVVRDRCVRPVPALSRRTDVPGRSAARGRTGSDRCSSRSVRTWTQGRSVLAVPASVSDASEVTGEPASSAPSRSPRTVGLSRGHRTSWPPPSRSVTDPPMGGSIGDGSLTPSEERVAVRPDAVAGAAQRSSRW